MAAGASHGMNIDDFNGDNFDHARLGFFGGAWISAGTLQRPSDRDAAGAARHAALGPEWKQATAKWYNHAVQHRRVRLQLRAPRELSRSRPDLQGCARPSADPHDASISTTTTTRWRNTSAACSTRSRRAMNPTHQGPRRRADRQLQRRAVSIDAQHRRHDHGHRSASRARSTATARPGTRTICSSWARRCSRRTRPTIRPGWSARWPIRRRKRSPRST